MRAPRRPRPLRLPVNVLLPNLITVLGLCAGLTSIRFALQDRWEAAILAILVAAVLDALDGRVARLLKATSRFGAELDSLSDFVCFGVAPALILYRWSLGDLGNVGWVGVLFFAACCALRLARFNAALDDPDAPAWAARFFTGVPAPAGAGLVLLPMIGEQAFTGAAWRWAYLDFAWCLFIGLLMVSRLPTFSMKKVRIRRELAVPMLLAGLLLIGLLVSEPWYTLFFVGAAYLASFPFSLRSHAYLVKATTYAEYVADPLIDTGPDPEAGADAERTDDSDDEERPPGAPVH